MIEVLASLVIPAVLLLCSVLMLKMKKRGGEAFMRGARHGLECTVSLMPSMLLLCVGLSMFTHSGAVEMLTKWLGGACEAVGIPTGIIPLVITRPVSGAASTAAFSSLLEQFGADSREGMCASVLMGSSDTLIYVISVYFSAAVGVQRTRYAFAAAGIVMVFCVWLSCRLC